MAQIPEADVEAAWKSLGPGARPHIPSSCTTSSPLSEALREHARWSCIGPLSSPSCIILAAT